ncbi:TPA: phage major capsid protein [Pseudomonas aeruginosa]
MNRAYSVLEVKALDDGQRVITGIATTPTPDRVGDIVEPLGVEFKNPLPLLWQHDHDKPVGTVKFDKPTAKGITFTAKLADVQEEGKLKERIDEAWQSLKANLVRGVSIGFRPLEYSWMDDGGIRFLQTEVYELSLVTIPCNVEATISTIKSLDRESLAALGHKAVPVVRVPPAGASASKTKSIKSPKPEEGNEMKTIASQIANFEATLKEKQVGMDAILDKSAEEGVTLDADQREEYDTLKSEADAIEKHLDLLRDKQKREALSAKPVAEDERVKAAAVVVPGKAPAVVHSVKNEEPGVLFARHAIAMFAAKGNPALAAELAKQHYGEKSPVTKTLMAAGGRSIESILKATVAAATTTDATWAGPLLEYVNYSGDFVEFLRPRTIVGQFGLNGVPSLRRIPFNVHINGQTSGGTGYWVGQGAPKPVTKFDFNDVYHGWFKVAGISVVSDETIRFSDPAIEVLVRDGLADALVERMNVDFIDPTFAGTANISPASILNGATAIPSSGNDADAIRADVMALEAVGDDANNPMTESVYIMHPKTARALSLMQNPLGQSEFPGISKRGGTFMGTPVITSAYVPFESAGAIVALVNASDVYYSDDGQATVDFSKEASIQMLDNPTNNSATGTATSLVSMYQTDSTAFRAHRFANWSRRRESGVAYLTGVNWGA